MGRLKFLYFPGDLLKMFNFACPVKSVFIIEPGLNYKEGKNFNHPSTICRSYWAGRNTLSILRINPPTFSGKLKFEPDHRGINYASNGAGAGIRQKGTFCKNLPY
jgi:hypothetical protein